MTSTDVVLDTSAVIELLLGSKRGETIRDRITGKRWFVTPATVSEVVSKTYRSGSDSETAFRDILDRCVIVETRAELGYDTGMFHAIIRRHVPKFSYGDAAVVAAAQSLGATIVTCDEDFRHVKDAVVVR